MDVCIVIKRVWHRAPIRWYYVGQHLHYYTRINPNISIFFYILYNLTYISTTTTYPVYSVYIQSIYIYIGSVTKVQGSAERHRLVGRELPRITASKKKRRSGEYLLEGRYYV